MKSFGVFSFIFLLGICSAFAQDIIILKDGSMIESKVVEVSTSEIRYKRFDHLEGPTIVITSDKVLSIKYQNGTYEIINADTKNEQKNTQTGAKTTALPTDKFIFAINYNPGCFIPSSPAAGPSICFEFGKGNFNCEVNFLFPLYYYSGFGVLTTFNYFWHNRIGGFYLGGGIGSAFISDYEDEINCVTGGLNVGWKFVTKSGLYFRTGIYIGLLGLFYKDGGNDLYYLPYIKPDLAIGYCFK